MGDDTRRRDGGKRGHVAGIEAPNLTNTGSTAQTVERARLAVYLSDTGAAVLTGVINGERDDTITLYDDWDDVDQQITIPAGESREVSFTFSPKVRKGDFFGIAVEYDGAFANYYVQVPGPGG